MAAKNMCNSTESRWRIFYITPMTYKRGDQFRISRKNVRHLLQAAIADDQLSVDNFDAAIEQIHSFLKGACFGHK